MCEILTHRIRPDVVGLPFPYLEGQKWKDIEENVKILTFYRKEIVFFKAQFLYHISQFPDKLVPFLA